MTFFFKKKLIKDRIAGLSFRWRGGARSNSSGAIVATVFTFSAAFFLLYAVNVETPQFNVQKKLNVSQVHLISAEDEQISSLRQFASPLPDRWDPVDDPHVDQRVSTAMRLGLLKQNTRPLALIPIPANTYDLTLPKVVNRTTLLNRLHAPSNHKKPEKGTCEASLNFSSAELEQQLLTQLNSFPYPLEWNQRGLSDTFILNINSQGKVVLCTPVGTVAIKGTETWLRQLRFKPSPKATRLSKLTFKVKGVTP